MKKGIEKPELLVPAGNPEAFLAALEGGADAVYLGVSQFNARSRAKNFRIEELPHLIQTAKKYYAKLYLTLNTLIKNTELKQFIRLLTILETIPIDAIIIQDWGVYWIIKKYFPKIRLHCSTQMGNHNSLDCNFSAKLGFDRVVLARELSLSDLEIVTNHTRAALEIFIHGALCYSYSGYCLMSSYLGGNSANRGLCRQPCRQLYGTPDRETKLFCMKDLQLIDYLPQICKAGVKTLKIEGRMRSAEYVWRVAKAYRMALDDFTRIPEAKVILKEDCGREKTAWRFDSGNQSVITQINHTGIYVGSVIEINDKCLKIQLSSDIVAGNILYVYQNKDESCNTFTAKIRSTRDGIASLDKPDFETQCGDHVFRQPKLLACDFKFSPKVIRQLKADPKKIEYISKAVSMSSRIQHKQGMLYYRISDLEWLQYLPRNSNGIICPVGMSSVDMIVENRLIPETPLYIDERDIGRIRNQIKALILAGVKEFSLSRLSHTEFFSSRSSIDLIANEYVYSMNDAACKCLTELGIRQWISPWENDFPNILGSIYRNTIIPMYFYPNLYVSKLKPFVEEQFSFEKQIFNTRTSESMYVITPQKPVCITGFSQRLQKLGYNSFLFDLSKSKPDKTLIEDLLTHFNQAKPLHGTGQFNFKKGLH